MGLVPRLCYVAGAVILLFTAAARLDLPLTIAGASFYVGAIIDLSLYALKGD